MAEKKKTTKKKNPRFGGKRDLKDTSGNKSIGFEDTFLGDLLGFDGKIGTKGKPGLLASLGGARRKKPGTTTTPTKKKTTTKKKSSSMSDAQKRRQVSKTTSPTVSDAQKRRQTKTPKVNFAATGGEPSAEQRRRQTRTSKPNEPGRNTNPIPVKPKAPTAAERKASHRRMMKRVTLQAWKDMSPAERAASGLPKNNREVFSATGALTLGAAKFTNAFKANRGGLAKKKPVAKMNKGGMAKKSGYMYGGSVTKKKPMNKGGMAKKK